MMYAIVKNVVTPASTSVRTVVWFADNLNKRSISWIAEGGILPVVYSSHNELGAGEQRLDCGINFLNHRKIARDGYCRASRRNKSAPSTIKRTFGNQTSSSGWACGFPRNVSPMITNRKYVVATIKPIANRIEVSRRCAVTPSGTPIIANATHANGNEKRLLISVRLALRSRLFSLFNCSSNCSIDNAERLGRFFCFSYSSSRLIGKVPSTMLMPSRIL